MALNKLKLNPISSIGSEFLPAVTLPSSATFTASVSSPSLSGTHFGSGANLTSLNASCISSGTIANAYLPATVSVTSVCGTHFGSGANLSSLNASNIASGTVGTSYLPAIVTLEDLIIAVSDETTNLTVGTSKVTFRMPYAMTLSSVRASVNTAPVGSTIIANVKQNGSSIFSTKVSIDASEKTSTTAAVPAVLSTTSLTDDSEITIDIDQVGSSIAGKGLKIVFKGTRV